VSEFIVAKSGRHEELREKFFASIKSILRPVIPAAVLFFITFLFTVIFAQFSQFFLESTSINYVNRGLILASIFAFIMLTIKLTTLLKYKTGNK
jgi:hypothetical protein